MCDCIARIDEALKPHNTKLALTLTFGTKGGVGPAAYPTIMTEVVTKQRGAKAATMVPTFCPFCGAKYEKAPT